MIFDNKLKKTKNNVKPYGFTIIGIIIIIIAILSVTTVAVVTYEVIKNNSESSSSEIQTSEDSNSSKTSSNQKTTSSNSSKSTDSDSAEESQTNSESGLRFFARVTRDITNSLIPEQINKINNEPLNQIAAGSSHTCWVINGSKIYCWGRNYNGQLGDNTTEDSSFPVAVDTSGILNGKTIKSISASYGHTCVIASDNHAYCWGYNNKGQLGNNSTANSLVPVAVDTSGILNGKTIKSISAGYYHTCVIASDNHAYCWGSNWSGQLGNGSTNDSLVPTAVDTSGVLSDKTIKSISVGEDYTCAIASDNQAYCWGTNWGGQFGNNTTSDSSIPVAVDTSGVLSGKTLSIVAAGRYHVCVISSIGKAYCWGSNWSGQLGNGSTNDSLVPTAVDTSGVLSGKTIKSISMGENHTCAIASDNQAYCWGAGDYIAQLGSESGLPGSLDDSSVPVAVDTSGVLNGKAIKSISGGTYHTCAIASDNQAYCWGANNDSQLGSNTPYISPITAPMAVDLSDVLNGKIIKYITLGDYHTCLESSDGQAYCWGANSDGQLGNNSIIDPPFSLTPTVVDTSGVSNNRTFNKISAEGEYTCAVASDDQVYCWGNNEFGQLGNNSTTNSSVPVAVDTSGVLSGKTILSVDTGINHTCAVASDDQVYCWGNNEFGQLGNNSTTNSSVPVAVDTSGVLSGKTIRAVSAGYGYTCAVASDNQVYCWGMNNYGQLGNGNTNDSLVPVAVNTSGVLSGKTIKSISTGSYHTCVVASYSIYDRAYCWGYNSSGQLGNNSKVASSVPVTVYDSGVIKNKNIKYISAGRYHTCVVANDYRTYCWGINSYGQLGNNSTTTSYSVPVSVYLYGEAALVDQEVKSINAGFLHTCVVTVSGKAYCWGRNFNGQLGNNSMVDTRIPVQVTFPAS